MTIDIGGNILDVLWYVALNCIDGQLDIGYMRRVKPWDIRSNALDESNP